MNASRQSSRLLNISRREMTAATQHIMEGADSWHVQSVGRYLAFGFIISEPQRG